jgi:hypothetical protein
VTAERRSVITAAVDDAIAAAWTSAPPDTRLLAIGWSTVETERAEREFGVAFDDAPSDAWLGARCRVAGSAFAVPLVLVEPATEGRLAASLARLGEGPVVAWYEPVAIAGSAGAGAADTAHAGAPERARAGASSGPFGPETPLRSDQGEGRFRFLVGTRTGTMPT